MKRHAEPYRPLGPAHALIAALSLFALAALAVGVVWLGWVLLLLVAK